MPEPNPIIELKFERALCSRHGEPFRHQWPKGYPIFVVSGLHEILQDPDFQDVAGHEIAKIEGLLDKQPLCCRLGEERLMMAYVRSEIGRQGKCRACGCHRIGTVFKSRHPHTGEITTHPHVCFHCVIHAKMG